MAKPNTPIRFVIDTNVFIALEPGIGPTEPGLEDAATFMRIAHEQGHQVCLSAATRDDLGRDANAERQTRNIALLDKYLVLARITPSPELLSRARVSAAELERNAHDRSDLEILASVDAHAADFLVTQDRLLRRRAFRAGLGEATLTVNEALDFLSVFQPAHGEPPPFVVPKKCYQLNAQDPIFTSLREAYVEFDQWLAKAQRQDRRAFVIENADQSLAALMITKQEDAREIGLTGRSLKACTFKVAPGARGSKFGELLLKTLFEEARILDPDYIYMTTFDGQSELSNLITQFGFAAMPGTNELGETVFVKDRRVPPESNLTPLEKHIRFGPPLVDPQSAVHIIPIRPLWHDYLFPELSRALPDLTKPASFGNAIRKAYVSAACSRVVRPGDTVLFYRSEDLQSVSVVGIVEDAIVSDNPNEILGRVGRRTVYSASDLAAMLNRGRQLLVILFRQDRILTEPWQLRELKDHHVLRGAPQSITSVRGEGAAWVHKQLGA